MRRISGALSLILVAFFVYLITMKGTTQPQIFLNWHGLVIVVGGLVVGALASFPYSVLKETLRTMAKSLNPKSHVDPDVAREMIEVSNTYFKNPDEAEKTVQQSSNAFFKECMNLLFEGIDRKTLVEIIDKRIEEKRNQVQNSMNVMLTLSKYAPALGLAATVLGLIDLLGQLQGADMSKLGYGMAIALTATFYGIIFSNLVFAPLSELFATSGEILLKEYEMIKEGIVQIVDKKHTIIVGEVLNSYLEGDDRLDLTGAGAQRSGAV